MRRNEQIEVSLSRCCSFCSLGALGRAEEEIKGSRVESSRVRSGTELPSTVSMV